MGEPEGEGATEGEPPGPGGDVGCQANAGSSHSSGGLVLFGALALVLSLASGSRNRIINPGNTGR